MLMDAVRATKYPYEAFMFVRRGLDFTVRRIHGDNEPTPAHAEEGLDFHEFEPEPEQGQGRHVSGRQLCEGLRDYAMEQFGLMARTVLHQWRITACEDFGHIVFAMVDCGLMKKTDDDTIADFTGVYDFGGAFPSRLQLIDQSRG